MSGETHSARPPTPTIADQSTAHAAKTGVSRPAQAKVFAAERAVLDARGVPAGVAIPGTTMPFAELLDVNCELTTLARIRARRPAVVVLTRAPGVRIAKVRV